MANNFAKLDMGVLFENSVFQNLRLQGDLNYYLKKSGVEIDFIPNKNIAYEVKIIPQESDLTILRQISESLSIKNYKIILKN